MRIDFSSIHNKLRDALDIFCDQIIPAAIRTICIHCGNPSFGRRPFQLLKLVIAFGLEDYVLLCAGLETDKKIGDIIMHLAIVEIRNGKTKPGQGEWTAVIGIMEGTFSKPMPIGGGKFIQPTGKAYKIIMATIGHWANGVMNEEYLFWDNQEFIKEIGLGK